ncbi:hypothetical protein D9V35_02385 [Commensalibacter melissae]|nr:hypothetical protein D9V35_02385 [Commensalibacter melissae]
MVATDFLSQALQYFMNILPGNVTFNLIVLLTFNVTLCTLITRFWKEPDNKNRLHKLWSFINFLASFKFPKKNTQISGKNDEKKII